jgi:hypothetical protein
VYRHVHNSDYGCGGEVSFLADFAEEEAASST